MAATNEDALRYELRDSVACLHLDDGKANALSPAVVEALGTALDRAEKEAKAVLLAGRPGVLSAGFDLKVMRSGPEPMRALVASGAGLYLRMLELPLPIVVACSGHALAAGALLLLASDARLGARGEFKLGLNEVAIGLRLPLFAVELARERLSPRHFDSAAAQARIYTPEDAVLAGYLDRTVPAEALLEEAQGEAERLATLPQPAFGRTKRSLHEAALARIRDTLDADLRDLAD